MAIYAQLSDCTDPVVTVTEADLENADVAVAHGLRAKGLDPEVVTLPQAILTQAAVYWATALAATKGNVDADGVLPRKATDYNRLYKDTMAGVTREGLGLAASSFGYGNAPLDRS